NDGGIIPVLANFHFFGDRKVWRMGWTAGGGLEYAFTDNWSLKAEYLFLDLRDLNYEAFCFTCNPNVGQSTNTRIEFREHGARGVLNCRLLGGESRVVARYCSAPQRRSLLPQGGQRPLASLFASAMQSVLRLRARRETHRRRSAGSAR